MRTANLQLLVSFIDEIDEAKPQRQQKPTNYILNILDEAP